MTQPAPQAIGTCNQCLYWQPLEVGGYCRRNAPPTFNAGTEGRVLWPRTLPTDWCGEWLQTTATRTTQATDG